MVSLTHKSTHVANEAEEAALWGVCATLAEGGVGTMRLSVALLHPSQLLLPVGFIWAWSTAGKPLI